MDHKIKMELTSSAGVVAVPKAPGPQTKTKWTKVESLNNCPVPRHGHRAIAYQNYMIILGGGNGGIIDDVSVYDIKNNWWFQPKLQGDIPVGTAAFGAALDGSRILTFGGMKERCIYTNDLYELNIPTWTWRKLKPKSPRQCPAPSPRLGHSFTIIRDEVYLFGGLTNDHRTWEYQTPLFLNDLYALKTRLNNQNGIWECPVTFGTPPSPRESHTAVAYVSKDRNMYNKLIIYGGMSGYRLGDVHFFDFDTRMWTKAELSEFPSPRSMHTATLVGSKMFVFGGWIPKPEEEVWRQSANNVPWNCTNSLACLNLETQQWESVIQDNREQDLPNPTAGHAAVAIDTGIYIWGGRDGFKRDADGWQRCTDELWRLDVNRPGNPDKVQLVKTCLTAIHVKWNPVPGAESYILQIVPYNCPFPS